MVRESPTALTRRRAAPISFVAGLSILAQSATAHSELTEAGLGNAPVSAPQHWTTEEALPENSVSCLLQSQDGYVWVGTRDGVARFDGVAFKVYRQELVVSEPGDANVQDLMEDGQGQIWFRNGESLAVFYKGRWTRYPLMSTPLKGINHACASMAGGLWLATTDGLKRFENGKITRSLTIKDGLIRNSVTLVHEDLQGSVWMAFGSGGPNRTWQRLVTERGTIETIEAVVGAQVDPPDDMFVDRTGRLWFWDPTNFWCWSKGQFEYRIGHPAWGHATLCVRDDPAGALYLRVDGHSGILRLANNQFTELGKRDGLASTDIRCVLVDREGGIWVGSGDRGLFRLQPKPFQAFLVERADGQKIETFSVAEGRQGRIWLGTSEGLKMLHNGQVQTFRNEQTNAIGASEQSLRAVLEDRAGIVWMGVRGEGLSRIRDGHLVREPRADCGATNDWTATTLFEDSRGNLWIGSDRGLIRRTPGDDFTLASRELGFLDQHITGIQEMPDGTLWVGTSGAGLYHLVGGTVAHCSKQDGLSSNSATPLLAQPDGTLWIGTPFGLNRLRNGKVRAVTVREGLFDNTAFCLLDDGRGNYWASCTRGIWRVREQDLDAVVNGETNWLNCVHFGSEDGLPSAECNGECQPCAARARDGRLFFAATRGVVVRDSNQVSEPEAPPVPVIEQVFVNKELVFEDGGLCAPWARSDGLVQFPRGRARGLVIRYTANSFGNPAKLRFEDRLDGYDPFWRDVVAGRVAFYPDLRPGNYLFEVRASDRHGLRSRTSAQFAFSIPPYFWQTRPFYVLCAIAGISLVVAVQAYRLRMQRNILRLEHERTIEHERARIARDLHDDLGTALTGLALEMEVTRRNLNGDPSAGTRLRTAADHLRALAGRMREVVWTVSPRCDNVPGLVSFLEQHAVPLVESAGLHCRLDLPEILPELPLSSEARYHLALGVREALTNVIRHAKATEVVLALRVGEQSLSVCVRDNGIGCGFIKSQRAWARECSRTLESARW